jgi:NAD(P)-dependent dehydrogenase (short-subunit alcohol dehydrogenase family)
VQDKTALVTGAASGIGAATSRRFVAEGAAVVLADRNVDVAEALAAELRDAGGRAVAVRYEATSEDDNRAAVQVAVDTFGGLDLLVTAAGIGGARSLNRPTVIDPADPLEAFLTAPIDVWQLVLDVNLTGTLLALQAGMGQMVRQGRGGAVVTLASVAAKHPEMTGPGSPGYGVSKAGVWMLTKVAAHHGARAGIRVNAVGPGIIDTPLVAPLKEKPGVLDHMLRDVPMQRTGTADEVAHCIHFLCSDGASFVTGELLHPDGGFFTG